MSWHIFGRLPVFEDAHFYSVAFVFGHEFHTFLHGVIAGSRFQEAKGKSSGTEMCGNLCPSHRNLNDSSIYQLGCIKCFRDLNLMMLLRWRKKCCTSYLGWRVLVCISFLIAKRDFMCQHCGSDPTVLRYESGANRISCHQNMKYGCETVSWSSLRRSLLHHGIKGVFLVLACGVHLQTVMVEGHLPQRLRFPRLPLLFPPMNLKTPKQSEVDVRKMHQRAWTMCARKSRCHVQRGQPNPHECKSRSTKPCRAMPVAPSR